MVSVWQRPLIDYFRATRGILVVTEAPPDAAHPVGGRLLYLGLQPRDPLSPADAPPTFDQREWPIDTLVSVTPTRTFFFVANALAIAAPRESEARRRISRWRLGRCRRAATRGREEVRHAARGRLGASRGAPRARSRSTRAGVRGSPCVVSHRQARRGALVRRHSLRGDAGQVRQWNGIVGDRIRIGQKLLVKPWTKKSRRSRPA